jgi:hypothetical protein
MPHTLLHVPPEPAHDAEMNPFLVFGRLDNLLQDERAAGI